MDGVIVNNQSPALHGHTRLGDDTSQISDLAEFVFSISLALVVSILTFTFQFSCPVCGQGLNELGPVAAQEQHVRNCLEGGSGPGLTQAGKYIVYRVRTVRPCA